MAKGKRINEKSLEWYSYTSFITTGDPSVGFHASNPELITRGLNVGTTKVIEFATSERISLHFGKYSWIQILKIF